MPNYLGEKKILVEDKERFMEEGDQPKSRERILWKSAKIGGKEGRLSSSFKGLKIAENTKRISRGIKDLIAEIVKEERRR